MPKEHYTQVAFIMLRKSKGEPLLNVPLYVKVETTNESGIPEGQEEMISKVSEIMNKRYESQIREYLATLKKETESDP